MPCARLLLPLPLVAATLLGGFARAAHAGDEVPAGPSADGRPSIDASIASLRSPLLAEREGAVADLIAAGPSARAAVVKLFRAGSLEVRPLLVRILAADASQEALDALLEALPDAKDAATTFAIQSSLVEHAERVGDAVRNWHGGKAPPRVAELAALLDRARVEWRFLSKKSQSGGTGSYPGQFEDLDNDADRQIAIDVCLGILANRAVKLPGRYPTGSYKFLRPPPFFVSREELRQMSSHAIAELARPTDTRVLDELVSLRMEFEETIANEREGRFKAAIEAALSDSILATLARLRPDDPAQAADVANGERPTWLQYAQEKVNELRHDPNSLDDAASLALQLREFEGAVRLYRELARRRDAISAYNLACAYARWSLAPGRRSAEDLRREALDAIRESVRRGYPDWAWMEQDRDLDAIRREPEFRVLVAQMKAAFAPRTRPSKPGARPGEPPEPATPKAPEPGSGMDR